MAKQYNNSLNNICSYSFTGSHLLVVQLVRSIPNNDKYSASKPQYFFMLTLAPGEKVDGGYNNDVSRTYKFEKSINIKYSIHELMSLGFSVKRFALGQQQVIGNYVKFSRSQTGTKRVTVWESSKVEKGQKGDITKRLINITLSANENHTFNFNVEDAHSFAEIVEILAKKAVDLEYTRQSSTNTNNNQVIYENKNGTQLIYENKNNNSNNSNNSNSPFSNIDDGDNNTQPEEVMNKFSNMISELPWD